MSNKYIITVIVPVYNVQEYIEECLSSIRKQTIGFTNIQLILVNDGSTDSSGSICRDFAREYPNNVIYIEQDNAGVSSARNRGIELAEGLLTTFLDADDKWSLDAFEIAYKAHLQDSEAGVISCRMCFFGSESGDHQLNYKYKSTRLVDIRQEYNVPQLSSSSVFIKTDVVKHYRYLEDQKYSEDFRFINEILLDFNKMILLDEPIYWYRKRDNDSSAMQKSLADSDYYIKTCKNVYEYLFETSKKKYGCVLRYLQFCVMYDLRWRLKVPLDDNCLSTTQQSDYVDIIRSLLMDIDDDIILEQKSIALALQLYALELKHNEQIIDSVKVGTNGIISYLDYPVFDLPRQPIIYINSINVQSDYVVITGEANLPFAEERFNISYSVDGVRNDISFYETESNIKTYLYGVLKCNLGFKIDLPIPASSGSELVFYVKFDKFEFVAKPRFKTSTALDKKKGFLRFGSICLYRTIRSIIIVPYSPLAFLLHLLRLY